MICNTSGTETTNTSNMFQELFQFCQDWIYIFCFFGLIYLFKLTLGLLLDLTDVCYAYIFPRLFASTSFTEKYGKWSIVTGCTQGIGRSYVEELAKNGMNVVLISRNPSKLNSCAQELKCKYGKILVSIMH